MDRPSLPMDRLPMDRPSLPMDRLPMDRPALPMNRPALSMSCSNSTQQMRSLLVDAITTLCKNDVKYRKDITIDGLLALTVDQQEVIVVPIRETIKQKEAISSAPDGGCQSAMMIGASADKPHTYTAVTTENILMKVEPVLRKRKRKSCSSSPSPPKFDSPKSPGPPGLLDSPKSLAHSSLSSHETIVIKEELESDCDSDLGQMGSDVEPCDEEQGNGMQAFSSADQVAKADDVLAAVQYSMLQEPVSKLDEVMALSPTSSTLSASVKNTQMKCETSPSSSACVSCGDMVEASSHPWSALLQLCVECIAGHSTFFTGGAIGSHLPSLHVPSRPSDIQQCIQHNLCPVCGKRFAAKSSLREHVNNIHMMTKKFACPYPGCESSFARKQHYQSHLNVHEGNKPFECPLCEVCFSGKQGMDRHLRICRLGRCTLCGAHFQSPDLLQNHMTEAHPASENGAAGMEKKEEADTAEDDKASYLETKPPSMP